MDVLIGAMADESQDDGGVGAEIRRRRKALGWSQAKLGGYCGTDQQQVGRIEKGQHSRVTGRLLEALRKGEAGLDPTTLSDHDVLPLDVTRDDMVGERDLPVYGVAEGGQGADIINSEPFQHIRRPTPLLGVRGAYAAVIQGESMVPAYRPGDFALVHPHLPPRPEDDVLVFAADKGGFERVMIKSLVRVRASAWLLQQWNPEKQFEASRSEWRKCHVVVGKYARR